MYWIYYSKSNKQTCLCGANSTPYHWISVFIDDLLSISVFVISCHEQPMSTKNFQSSFKYCPPVNPRIEIQFLNLKTAWTYSQKQTQTHLEQGVTLITILVLFSLLPPDNKIRYFFYIFSHSRAFLLDVDIAWKQVPQFLNRILNIDEEMKKVWWNWVLELMNVEKWSNWTVWGASERAINLDIWLLDAVTFVFEFKSTNPDTTLLLWSIQRIDSKIYR